MEGVVQYTYRVCASTAIAGAAVEEEEVDEEEEEEQQEEEEQEYRVGDDVFVRLGRDKSTGRARVVRERISDPHHPFHGRIQVQFYDNGSTYHVRPARMRRVYDHNVVLICNKTREYRRLARCQVTDDDFCIEIGCSWGKATAVLAQGCSKVIGIDISEEAISASKATYPRIDFLQLDCLTQEEELLRAAAGASVVFVDIGGNRDLQSVVKVVRLVQKGIRPSRIVIKSESLSERALMALRVEESKIGYLSHKWFQELYNGVVIEKDTG